MTDPTQIARKRGSGVELAGASRTTGLLNPRIRNARRAPRPQTKSAEDLGTWRDITDDAAAKEVFIRLMEQMDKRYRGLGAPSAPLKNPLDQQIDQRRNSASHQGMAILAWSPDQRAASREEVHLALAVTFDWPLGGQPGLERVLVKMVAINCEIYKRPSNRRIQFFARVLRHKLVDLTNVGLQGAAPYGASGVVIANRPRTMTWKPVWRLHNAVYTDPGTELLKEREDRHAIYWQLRMTKL